MVDNFEYLEIQLLRQFDIASQVHVLFSALIL
jgi:hypothetical protein